MADDLERRLQFLLVSSEACQGCTADGNGLGLCCLKTAARIGAEVEREAANIGWNAAIEAAAKLASEFVNAQNGPWNASAMRQAIRKLARPAKAVP